MFNKEDNTTRCGLTRNGTVTRIPNTIENGQHVPLLLSKEKFMPADGTHLTMISSFACNQSVHCSFLTTVLHHYLDWKITVKSLISEFQKAS